MNRNIISVACILFLAACAMPQGNVPNPASVYCRQQGNKLIIHTAADSSQQGTCAFPDGSTCEEWAYFRGECGPAPRQRAVPTLASMPAVPEYTRAAEGTPGSVMPPETTKEVYNWWGYIGVTAPDAQYDDYFERHDLGQVIYLGIDSLNPTISARIKALRGSGKVVHVYGTLVATAPDVNGWQVLVERIEVEGS